MVFGGTSVTAGHDNAYEQAYPFQFERMVQCAFAAAGIQLKVRPCPTPCPAPGKKHLEARRAVSATDSCTREAALRAADEVKYDVCVVRETRRSAGPHAATSCW